MAQPVRISQFITMSDARKVVTPAAAPADPVVPKKSVTDRPATVEVTIAEPAPDKSRKFPKKPRNKVKGAFAEQTATRST